MIWESYLIIVIIRGLYTAQTGDIFCDHASCLCTVHEYNLDMIFWLAQYVEQEFKPYSSEVIFLSYVNVIWPRNELVCCQHIVNSYVCDMLICLGVCALHSEEKGMHVLLSNIKWILLGSHLGYFLQVHIYHAVHIWNMYMVENCCQVWNQQYA
jgi:hypothetical protein